MTNTADSTKNIDENQEPHIIFASDDNRLKNLGEILANSTSRKIVNLLISEQMTASQISEKLGLEINLIMYHLDKMLELDLISIKKNTKSSRGHNVKHYQAKKAIMIFSENAKNKAQKSKALSKSVKSITRLSAIAITGISAWFLTNLSIQVDKITTSIDSSLKYPRPTLPPYMMPIEPQSSNEAILPIIIGVGAIIIASMLIYRKRFTKNFIKKKR